MTSLLRRTRSPRRRKPEQNTTYGEQQATGKDYAAWGRVQPKVSLFQAVAGAFRLCWQAGPVSWLVLVLSAMVSAACTPAILWAGRQLVNLVVHAGPGGRPRILPTVLVIGVLAVVQRVLSVVTNYRQQVFSHRVHDAAEERFLGRAVTIDIPYLDDPGFHTRMLRASKTSMSRPFAMSGQVVTFCGQLVALGGLVGVASVIHPALLVLVTGSVAVTAFAQVRVGRNVYEADLHNSRNFREMYYRRHLMTDVPTVKDLQGLGAERHMRSRHLALQRWYDVSRSAVYRKGQGEALVVGGISAALLTLAYWFVARQGLAGQLTAGDLFLVLGAFASVGSTVSALSGSVVALQAHAPYLRDYYEFLDLPDRLPVRRDPVPLPPDGVPAGLTLRNVTFSYPAATGPALRGIDLDIAPGEMVALVGDNGAGKTTLVKLLLRHYDPQEGRVLIGGVDVRDADPADLRSRFGVLFQDFAQYNLTVRENLELGRIGHEALDSELWTALDAARAGFVRELPLQLDATVGKLYEWGRDISGGQWQRLALARLMHRNADIWILDEPTSALDPEAEAAVFAQLRENLRGRIGIVISHRFSTVRTADRILVLQNGHLTESGTHDQLLALNGRYAHLFTLQATAYR